MKTEGIKGIFFDSDGVLVNSWPHALETNQAIARYLGLKVPTPREIADCWGLKWSEFVKELWPGICEQKVSETYERLSFHLEKIPAVLGAKEALLKLKQKNCFLALLSNRDEKSLLRLLEGANIPVELFNYFQSVEDAPAAKPNPRFFEKAIRALVKSRKVCGQIIYVGDTLTDFEATKRTKIKFVGVLTGATSREKFLQAGVEPDCILKSVAELPEFLKRR